MIQRSTEIIIDRVKVYRIGAEDKVVNFGNLNLAVHTTAYYSRSSPIGSYSRMIWSVSLASYPSHI